ncbi:MAG: hypothetical protein KDJ75_05430 [Alphaproteobacteria bacterium]|nr:hypothetical protein [Alphaproteobacteria bacterium]
MERELEENYIVMKNQKTLFIIGAGASEEVGLPIGSKLKEIIANKVNIKFENPFGQQLVSGDHRILSAVRKYVAQQQEVNQGYQETFVRTGNYIHSAIGRSPSIDYFLSSNADKPEVQLLGKLGIVHSILEAERSSPLYADHRESHDPKPKLDRILNTWYNKLFMKLSNGHGRTDFQKKLHNVDFIVFNYDRCVEHYFLHTVRNLYDLDQNQAVKLLEPLNIIHPYGTVGDLPWQHSNNQVAFGDDTVTAERLLGLSNKVATFMEQIVDQKIISRMQKLVENANTIIFLGFGFHDMNMTLLQPQDSHRVKNVYASAFNESKPSQDDIRDSILNLLKANDNVLLPSDDPTIHIYDKKCTNLFDEYGRRIASCLSG